MVFIKNYDAPTISKKEVLRYAGCKSDDISVNNILNECITEANQAVVYKVCYSVFDISLKGETCDFGAFAVNSHDLSANLEGCKSAVIFAATVGIGIDRLISKYSAVSPVKALMFQAIGAERIETLCDMFCEDITKELNSAMKPRFSPGYGDFDLSLQKEIFEVLNCEKNIGLTLTGSMLMSPSKSVTAIVGLCKGKGKEKTNKCELCLNEACSFRSVL